LRSRYLSSFWLLVVFALQASGLFWLHGCSVLLNSEATQCERDADCARFGFALCDVGKHVCVASPVHSGLDGGSVDAASADVTVSCQAPSGCFQCTASSDLELITACSDSTCVPFDNKRLTNLNPDGTLKPLP
jgi:hypothetical protein